MTVINQLNRRFKYIKGNFFKYFSRVTRLLCKFDDVEFEHVYLEENKEANDLAQIVSCYKLSEQNFESFMTIKEKLPK